MRTPQLNAQEYFVSFAPKATVEQNIFSHQLKQGLDIVDFSCAMRNDSISNRTAKLSEF